MHIFKDSTNPHPKRDVPDSLKKTPTPAIQSFFDESLGTRLKNSGSLKKTYWGV